MRSTFFDLDGTLTDPKSGITRCIQHAMSELGVEVPRVDDLLWCIGPPLLASLEKLVGQALAPQALVLYRERFAEVGLFENALYPGIESTLEHLSQSGQKLFVASSKPKVYVERILEHFYVREYFADVFGSELDGTRVDKTELLGYALGRTGLASTEAVMVGDREHDGIGAGNNGMRFVGVAYGYGSVAELQQSGASDIAHTVEDLPALLQPA